MRHRVSGRRLGRDAAHRRALFRNLITELFRHEAIETTEARARAVRGDAERLITLAKRAGSDDGNPVHARRLAAREITDPTITRKLFDELAPRFVERPGGYTRMVKLGPRRGDAASMVLLELVEE